eukprot:NODE_351_length_8976_cov_1.105666.p5 type:complete len:185 gc:universal NODE_351_length_8976_cov_1.105666:5771-5217(-)
MSSVKYQYFQTDTSITVEIYKPDADIKIEDQKIAIHNDDSVTEIFLAYKVIPSESKIEKGKKKQSVILKKVDAELWPDLQKKDSQPKELHAPHPKPEHEYIGKSYHQWDRLKVEDEEKDKEGGGDPNDFFKKLFKDVSPEAQKAMQKSFLESGGTVLSTNWDEVKNKKVEVKPPEGMVEKKYEI